MDRTLCVDKIHTDVCFQYFIFYFQKMDDSGGSPLTRTRSLTGYVAKGSEGDKHELSNRVNMRGNGKRRHRQRRLSIINGHIFDAEVSDTDGIFGVLLSTVVL